jgi:hypothetical protein
LDKHLMDVDSRASIEREVPVHQPNRGGRP